MRTNRPELRTIGRAGHREADRLAGQVVEHHVGLGSTGATKRNQTKSGGGGDDASIEESSHGNLLSVSCGFGANPLHRDSHRLAKRREVFDETLQIMRKSLAGVDQ